MYLSIVLGILVFCSLCMSVCRLNVSNVFERSIGLLRLFFFYYVVYFV